MLFEIGGRGFGAKRRYDNFTRERYVCVEPGYVRGFAKVPPEGIWVGKQVLSA